MVYRVYVEKKRLFAVDGAAALSDLNVALGIKSVENVRVVNRYDVEGLTEENFKRAVPTVFSEPPVDDVYFELPKLRDNERMFAVEFLPGQFDQRADSAAQCIQMLCKGERPDVKYAKIYVLSGNISDEEFERIKHYLINAVESRECGFEEKDTLKVTYTIPTEVETLKGFIEKTDEELADFVVKYGLAMDNGDIKFCQEYFKSEHRDPTITEIRMIDTYWSDHCRHTTFGTIIDKADIKPPYIENTFADYRADRTELGRDNKPICLMDIATLAAKKLKKDGLLPDLDESEEINACSVKITVDVDGKDEEWLLMFKNETHNHPTEIEPFGGAATCLGGAIRDPLSGRSYVYQAMRVTGASDPLLPVEKTLKGKLPPRKITTTAAAGYSSYGNQIGLATGHVAEIYHPGYMAKRMEIGAVVGAAPAENVRRERPAPGDVIILLGGRTGRDGCGGATGSSKSHSVQSLDSCGAEVQKGNAPEERKLQRLFRDPEATRLIKRCNDFGAGGVSVAIGELADGLEIDLNAVPKKYDGLDGTELAISESQERMAVVVAPGDVEKFRALASKENLESTVVATVKAEPRLKMNWNGKTIVDISREFLNSNGAEKHTDVFVPEVNVNYSTGRRNTAEDWEKLVTDLNVCSQRGLVQRFDSTIGGGTVLMPFAGRTQQTPVQAMAAKIPVLNGSTTTASIMGWGFNPAVSSQSPYHGAICAVVESIAKVVAAGGSSSKCWLTFQEYFERTQGKAERWGKPFAALLGAYKAQTALGCGAIGGKDSMSGTFDEQDGEQINVPPTLVSFAVSTAKADKIISAEFKIPYSKIGYIAPRYDKNGLPDFSSVKEVFKIVEKLIADKKAISVWSVANGGAAEGIFKMGLGNRVGAKLEGLSDDELFTPVYGAFILELEGDEAPNGVKIIGETIPEFEIISGGVKLDMAKLEEKWNGVLEPVFRQKTKFLPAPEKVEYTGGCELLLDHKSLKIAKPKVLLPVFPGTNCEYDMAAAFERYGAESEIFVIRNLSASDIEESVEAFAKLIDGSQMIAVPGGFSGGDEPEGSAKFINAFFRNPKVAEAVENMLHKRDGLMIGICNGFQALIKLGLVPFGHIVPLTEESPTLTYNEIGRHQSQLVYTRICTNKSPWLANCKVGDIHAIPLSHGEGRFVAGGELLRKLIANGQILTQYVDLKGEPSMDTMFNPNGSMCAVEGIISPDGRVLGKMCHTERLTENCCVNVDGDKEQLLFKSGVEYFL
ncbi:MAG: phosphoribosylformylglycinamidine synthase [Oscillospiraceae bacterium]|nr:phosphoribosylformylglycinamidine synthase [Oscillospiraceae bacterium]